MWQVWHASGFRASIRLKECRVWQAMQPFRYWRLLVSMYFCCPSSQHSAPVAPAWAWHGSHPISITLRGMRA
ncbi:MAG: hypothetical protein ACRELC_14835 [Gemmatimonadota bacterium]